MIEGRARGNMRPFPFAQGGQDLAARLSHKAEKFAPKGLTHADAE